MNLFKKFLLIIGAFGCVSISAFEGFYVGGSIGGIDAIGKQTGEVVGRGQFNADPANVSTTPMNLRDESVFSHFVAALYAGYGFDWHCLYSGLEVFGQYHNEHDSLIEKQVVVFPEDPDIFQLNDQTTSLISHWHFGADYRPGVLLTPLTLLYGRVGVSVSSIKIASKATNEGIVPPESWFVSLSDFKKQKKAHLHLGGGIEQQLSSKLSLRVDYTYTDFGNISFDNSVSGVTDPNAYPTSITESKNLHLYNHALKFGLAYYFCPNLSCPSLTPECWIGCNNFGGVYLAGALGGTLSDIKIRGDAVGSSQATPQTVLPVEHSSHLSATEGEGVIYAGYGWQCKGVFVGFEVFGQHTPFSRTKTNQTTYIIPNITSYVNQISTTTKIKPWQFGVEIRPGILATPFSLLYGTIGTSVATIEADSNIFYNLSSPFIQDGSLPLNVSRKSTRAVLRIGGGIEHMLTHCLHLRFDYIYTDYGTLHLNGSAEAEVITGNVLILTDDSRVKFSGHSATLGIVWYL